MASPRTYIVPGSGTGPGGLVSNADAGNVFAQRFDRLFDNATPWATVTSGSEPDDVTVSVNSNESGTPQDTAFLERGWLAGMGVRLAWPVTNTGAVTLAVNGGSALNIVTPEGDAIAAGQFPQGLVVELVYYDGDLVVVSAIPDATGGAQARFWYVFTVSGTWTKPVGLGDDTAWHARLWGAGGGGQNVAFGRGGSGGACAPGVFRHGDLPSSVVVTIGAGGALGNPGGNGGNSTFGSLLTGYGGGGGAADTGGGGLLSAGTTTEPGIMGGGGTGDQNATNQYGGGAGAPVGGRSLWGGGGGTDTGTPGDSVFGGDGGTNGVAGQAPGGGGGRNAQGARGEFWFFN